MIIEINPDWRISSDSHQWILERLRGTRKDRKTGQPLPNWKPVGYFASLSTLLKRLIDLRVWRIEGTHPPEALEHVCNALSDMKAEVRDALSNIDRDYLRLVAARDASGENGTSDILWTAAHGADMGPPANDVEENEKATRHRSAPPSRRP